VAARTALKSCRDAYVHHVPMSSLSGQSSSAPPTSRASRLARSIILGFGVLLAVVPLEAAKQPRAVEAEKVDRATDSGPPGVHVVVSETIAREALPDTLFGFNLNFYNFQEAYLRDGVVHGDVQNFLRALPGAIYRFLVAWSPTRMTGKVRLGRPVSDAHSAHLNARRLNERPLGRKSFCALSAM